MQILPLPKSTAIVVVCCALLWPHAAWAQDDALPFSKSYTITGNYIAAGVDLDPKNSSNGFANGTIAMSGVPANADVLVAFLYWETISTLPSQIAGAQFRGLPLTNAK